MIGAVTWLCVGIQIAFVAVMQIMSGVLGENRSALTSDIITLERAQFFNVQWWSLVLTIVVGGAAMILDYRHRKLASTNV